jgi:hypothetical protein
MPDKEGAIKFEMLARLAHRLQARRIGCVGDIDWILLR